MNQTETKHDDMDDARLTIGKVANGYIVCTHNGRLHVFNALGSPYGRSELLQFLHDHFEPQPKE